METTATPAETRVGRRWQRVPVLAGLLSHIPAGQLGRYLLVGVWNTLFGYATFAGLTAILDPHIPHGYILATLVSSFVNITVAFLAYKWLVFKTRGNYLREWLRCVAVYSGSIALNLLLLPVVVETLRHTTRFYRGAPYLGGAFVSGLTLIVSFVGHKKFSFRSPS